MRARRADEPRVGGGQVQGDGSLGSGRNGIATSAHEAHEAERPQAWKLPSHRHPSVLSEEVSKSRQFQQIGPEIPEPRAPL